MAFPTITPLPSAPQRGESESVFTTKSNAWVAALPSFGAQMNVVSEFCENKAIEASDSATQASGYADNSQGFANDAAASATAASLAANVVKWVVGDYNEGDVVWSPMDYQTYRSTMTQSSSTDPSEDTVGWKTISTLLPDQTGNAGKALFTDGVTLYFDDIADTSESFTVAGGKISRPFTVLPTTPNSVVRLPQALAAILHARAANNYIVDIS